MISKAFLMYDTMKYHILCNPWDKGYIMNNSIRFNVAIHRLGLIAPGAGGELCHHPTDPDSDRDSWAIMTMSMNMTMTVSPNLAGPPEAL